MYNQTKDILFEKFAITYKKYISKDYLEFFNEEDLKLFLNERWNFIFNRDKLIQIKCYNSQEIWPLHTSIIQVNLNDMPFIVDTILDYLKSEGYRIYRVINAILYLKREKGKITEISTTEKEDFSKESFVYIEIERLEDKILQKIKKQILYNLQELKIIVNDFPKINDYLKKLTFSLKELNEDKNWIIEYFIQMGLLFLLNNQFKNELGILKNKSNKEMVLKEINEANLINKNKKEAIYFKESFLKSNVKRYKPLHIVIFIKDKEKYILLGSFAGKGEISPRFLIPPIRRKLDKMAKLMNAPFNGFRYKEIFKIAQLIPLGILFSRNIHLLTQWLDFFINNLYTNEQKILITEDEDNQGIWVLIIELQKFADTNDVLNRNLEKFQIQIDTYFKRTYNQFLYTFLFLRSKDNNIKKLKQLLTKHSNEIFYSWYDQFVKYLTYAESSLDKIKFKLDYYKEIIPPSLPNYISPKETYNNIKFLESITKDKKFYVKFGKSISPITNLETLTLNIFSCYYFTLTEIFPVLESAGLNITTEISFDFLLNNQKRYLNIFYLENEFKKDWQSKIEQGIEDLLNQKYSIEVLNQLLISTSLTIREINFIKTIIAYYYQLHKQYSRIYLQDFFIHHQEFAELLINYLKEIFSPENREKNNINEIKDKLLDKIKQYIFHLKTISEQTIALNILEIIENIVRTNYFLNYEEIAIKVQTNKITYIKEPKPLFEIFVYSKEMEAIHIRSDYIARGGIRWSDRIDDFRIEIYDLMKTQMVKNTVIVPNGAKGGFVIKKNISQLERKEQIKASEYYYRKFINNLLSITDNYINKKVIPPDNVIRLDNDDPYLVVAADKGTATFSDIANEIANQKNFWLKDAFASGGSFGYDHKKQGITAKGAWESVKRHFSELQINPEKDIITVIGIGDMGGDVFGNGMLLSKSIKLIAAFNHKHIFIDPDPDPEISYNERLRLFKEVKGWEHYNTNLFSKGGGIFERNAARINISKEIRERFNIPKNVVSGEELIQYILKAKADLLWNGGIGTYIKSSIESNKDVMDPSNDNVRINANELNVRVIGEGGNLGLTMKARIEAALKGILLNTDFIDNSGGVDMSDHEVNLKIFLNHLVDKNIISFNKRNQFIKKYENIMIENVLKNNRFNNLAIALERYRLLSYKFILEKWIHFLESQNIIPEKEIIINDKITQPEICLLLGYTKLYFKKYFNQNEINYNDLIVLSIFRKYFPEELIKKYKNELMNHPLKNKIITTIVLNDLINSLGLLHFFIFNEVLNKKYEDLLKEYVFFKNFINFNILDLYVKYYELPKSYLYEQLIDFGNATLFIHFFLSEENLNYFNNNNQFMKNINKLIKFIEINNINIPKINNKNLIKKMKELNAFVNSYEIGIIHFFINKKDIISFYKYLDNTQLLKLFYIIKNVNINNMQELKFQFRLLRMYFTILKTLSFDEDKSFINIKDYLASIFKKDKEIKLIDLFEILMGIESL
ncbi:MAG: NAD-glutamate dehydrogenase [Leptospiraceae bacterium]|nr:MAG: NAD-glutamate dehydrogenase [Leptospiraceae bacterium]